MMSAMMMLIVYFDHVDIETVKHPPSQTPDIDFDNVSNNDIDSLF